MQGVCLLVVRPARRFVDRDVELRREVVIENYKVNLIKIVGARCDGDGQTFGVAFTGCDLEYGELVVLCFEVLERISL